MTRPIPDGFVITDDMIRALKKRAEQAGRLALSARCDDALDEDYLSRKEVLHARKECASEYHDLMGLA